MSVYLDDDDYVASGYGPSDYFGDLESLTGDLDCARVGYANLARGLAATAVTVSSDATATPKDAPLRPDTVDYWSPTSMDATWRVDLGAAQQVSFIGIAGHSLGSSGCQVTPQYSSDDVTYYSITGCVALPSDDSAILMLFPPVSRRYWRLSIAAAASPTEIPRLSSIYIGDALVMQRKLYSGHAPITLSRDTVLQRSLSIGGQFLGQSFRRRGFIGDAAFRFLTPSWYRTYLDPFVQAARQYPYFFAWRPGSYADEAAYVWTDKDIRPANMGVSDLMHVAWSMRGLGDE